MLFRSAVVGNLGALGGVIGGKAGDTLKGVGGALNNVFGGGQPPPKVPANTTTNAAPNQAAPPAKKVNPLDLLNPFLKKK